MAQIKQNFRRKNVNLGKISNIESLKNGIHVFAENGWLQIDFYRSDVLRVRAGKTGESLDDFSMAVIASPEVLELDVNLNPTNAQISSDAIQIVISSETCALSFFDKQGNLLNADDPAFGISWLGNEVTAYKSIQNGERFVGLGEKTGPLDRKGNSYTNWNTDNFAYAPDADPLYLTAPFYMGIHSQGMYGIFFDNSHKTHFNFGATNDRFSYFSAEDGQMDYYFFQGNTPLEIVQSYTWLTGRMPMPPKWSLGFQQCRYSYYPDKEVLRIAETFREKSIPADVIYLDIHYMDAFKVFTWHPERFPDPKGLVKALEDLGFKVVLIVDPGLKSDENYPAYLSGKEGDHYVKYPDGTEYKGQVWPGWSVFPDFTNEEARKWWGEQLKIYTDAGVEGFWNDMNEPAAWGQDVPHLIEFDLEGRGTTLKEARNLYGMCMARATREGAQKLLGEKRPFILTRAGYSGVQRYAAVWTGDNVATDEHMLAGHRLVNSLGLTGIQFSGYDIGGFAGEASPALFARWMALGAFTPFFRAHTMINTRDSEPWSFGEEVEDISRNYINLRYRLLPYIYSAFEEAASNGTPINRSLVLEWPMQNEVFSKEFDTEYMFGAAILVAPIASTKDLAKVFLPKGNWYNWFNDEQIEGDKIHIAQLSIETLPLYVRESAVIPMQKSVQHVHAQHDGILEIHIYAGNQSYETTFYEDDGKTNAYLNGKYSKRKIFHDGAAQKLTIQNSHGDWKSDFEKVQFIFHGLQSVSEVQVNGQEISPMKTNFRLVEPVSRFDPFLPEIGEVLEIENLPIIEVPYSDSVIEIRY